MVGTLAEFASRKEAAARAAQLETWTTEIDSPDPDLIPIGNDWSRSVIDGDFYLSPSAADLPATSLVFVQSRDGNTAASNPAALGGGATDLHVIYEGLSRVAADAVMAGAETIRGGNILFSVWRPELVDLRASLGLPRHPVQIVATLRGVDLERGLLFNVPEVRVLLVTIALCARDMDAAIARRPWITPVIMEEPSDLSGAFREIRRLGITRLSCVGGRTIARQLIDAGLIQDLYMTTAAKDGGQPGTPLYPRPLDGKLVTRKRGTRRDEGVRFEHRRLG